MGLGSFGSCFAPLTCVPDADEVPDWCDRTSATPVSEAEMRDPLPTEVTEAFRGWRKLAALDPSRLSAQEMEDFLGGHGGSHAYLVNEFVSAAAAGRTPACAAWDAANCTAASGRAPRPTASRWHRRCGNRRSVPRWGDAAGGSPSYRICAPLDSARLAPGHYRERQYCGR